MQVIFSSAALVEFSLHFSVHPGPGANIAIYNPTTWQIRPGPYIHQLSMTQPSGCLILNCVDQILRFESKLVSATWCTFQPAITCMHVVKHSTLPSHRKRPHFVIHAERWKGWAFKYVPKLQKTKVHDMPESVSRTNEHASLTQVYKN